MGGGSNGGQLISVYPEELTFGFELGKPCYCNIKVVNNTEHHVAFKVKTTSPKKYFVRPNTRVVQPWDSQIITVTLQAQSEYPSDMQCKDKFLIQSTIVPPSTDIDEVPPNTFNRDTDRAIEEHKLRVVYTAPGQSSESGLASPISRGSRRIFDNLPMTWAMRTTPPRELQAPLLWSTTPTWITSRTMSTWCNTPRREG